MTDTSVTLIIGASHAGVQAAVSLRQGGYEGRVILIGDEVDLPYHRPPLSKDYLSGGKSLGEILLRPAASYADADIELKLAARITSLNPAEKTITSQDGETLAYDHLILATGARVRKLPIDGADHERVYYLRDAKDVRAIMARAKAGLRAVIIGGGYIGLETAASLKKQGLDVTVL